MTILTFTVELDSRIWGVLNKAERQAWINDVLAAIGGEAVYVGER